MARFTDTHSSPSVDMVPFFASGTVADATFETVVFDNLTHSITVTCTSGSDVLLMGVAAAGVTGTQRVAMSVGNTFGPLDVRCKQLIFRGSGGTMGFQVFAVLTRAESDDYPDIDSDNGFDGVGAAS